MRILTRAIRWGKSKYRVIQPGVQEGNRWQNSP